MRKIKIGLFHKTRRNFILQQKYAGKENVIDTTDKEVEHHYNALTNAGYQVDIIKWDEDIIASLRNSTVDIFFNVSSLTEVALLDEFELPYVGSDIYGSASSLDKGLAKRLWVKDGLLTSPFTIVSCLEDCEKVKNTPEHHFPMFLKPLRGRGSSGIDENALVTRYDKLLIEVQKRLKRFKQPVLIENFLEGREITCGIIGNKDRIRALPLLEIKKVGTSKFLTFEKKEADIDNFLCPAPLESKITKQMQTLAGSAYKSLGLRDFARIDMILTESGPYLLEANCFAGLTCTPREKPHSYMGFMAVAENKSSGQFLDEIVQEAFIRLEITNQKNL